MSLLRFIQIFVGFCMLMFCMHVSAWPTPAVAKVEITRVIYPADEEKGDPRFNDVKEILRVALEKTVVEFGPFELLASRQHTNGLRYLNNLANDSDLNVVWSSTTEDKERNYLPIRIPLRKGLLGYRLLLVHKDKQALLKDVKSLEDLKKFSVGQGVGWDDVKLYEANGIAVVEAKYSNLFRMLSYKRFDFFFRAVSMKFLQNLKRNLGLILTWLSMKIY